MFVGWDNFSCNAGTSKLPSEDSSESAIHPIPCARIMGCRSWINAEESACGLPAMKRVDACDTPVEQPLYAVGSNRYINQPMRSVCQRRNCACLANLMGSHRKMVTTQLRPTNSPFRIPRRCAHLVESERLGSLLL